MITDTTRTQAMGEMMIEAVTIPKAAIDWLMGEGPGPDGLWFGDHPVDRPPVGAFWWRKDFQRMIELYGRPSPAPDEGGVSEAEVQGLIKNAEALLRLDAEGALVPHGIGGLAREIIEKLVVLARRRSGFAAGREAAARAIETIIESQQEGLMTDAGLTQADRKAMAHQISALEAGAEAIRQIEEPAPPASQEAGK